MPFKWHLIEVRTRNKPATTDIQGISGGLGEAVTTKVETWPGGVFEPTTGKLEVLSPGMVKVTWSAPQGLYGIVQEYYVLVKENDKVERKETVPPTTTSITLTALPANYKIYVQAKIAPNSQGMGGGLSREVLIEETTGTCKFFQIYLFPSLLYYMLRPLIV
ncbi:unnamed protein product [Dibothriocephalus latus]|uniref:Fibronectin type-III domain-containing protein n=1 Tax=Dibothriocephalus latus TaxID=60516 RepID=A0A3P7R1G5_DIBLA|nr:unnamed protein product [Dibothriocephalus latus]